MRLRVESVHSVATVGDTVDDLIAGHRAGAAVVAGVLTGAHSRAELEVGPSTDLIDDVAACATLIAGRQAAAAR